MRPVSAMPALLLAAAVFAAPARVGDLHNFDDAALHAVQFVDKFEGWAVGDDGVVYAGTSSKGLLYRITAPGRATVVYDFRAEDVHAIAVGPGRTVWAIVNETACVSVAPAASVTVALIV